MGPVSGESILGKWRHFGSSQRSLYLSQLVTVLQCIHHSYSTLSSIPTRLASTAIQELVKD